jgi:pullulanase/glycogen debranching enzyme
MQSADWNDAAQRCIGVRLGAAAARETSRDGLLIVFNAGETAVDFVLPAPSPSMQWLLVFDTGDSVSGEQLRSADAAGVTIAARSSVLLEQVPR